MNYCKIKILNKIRTKLKEAAGVTMTELLIVVAIIAVLGGVAFIAVWNYQRSFAQLERDSIAKEIFIAAQNHLTAAYGEGYPEITDYGISGTADGDNRNNVYYITVNHGTTSANGIFELMLPFGAIDETIRTGGSYIIRYQPETAAIMDVFYCSTNNSPAKFNHTLTNEEYETVIGLRDTDETDYSSQRRTYEQGNDSVLGWYGGESASALPTIILDTPSVEITNADKLTVKATDPNYSIDGARLHRRSGQRR